MKIQTNLPSWGSLATYGLCAEHTIKETAGLFDTLYYLVHLNSLKYSQLYESMSVFLTAAVHIHSPIEDYSHMILDESMLSYVFIVSCRRVFFCSWFSFLFLCINLRTIQTIHLTCIVVSHDKMEVKFEIKRFLTFSIQKTLWSLNVCKEVLYVLNLLKLVKCLNSCVFHI